MRKQTKRQSASAHPGLPYSKKKNSGQKLDVISAEQYQKNHTGQESDLQEAVEKLCGLYGFIREGSLTKQDKVIPQNCNGVWHHVPNSAFAGKAGRHVGRYLKNHPDIVIDRRDGACLRIELKRNGGRRTPGQKILARIIPVHLVKSAEHAEKLIKNFSTFHKKSIDF